MKSLVRFALAASLVAGSATLAFAADIALDQPVTTDGLVALLKEHRDGERRAIIYYDRMAPGGRLVEVTNLAHQNGYAVALATVSPQQ